MSASDHGLGVIMAIIFLAGEMAGVGVLALPKVNRNVCMNVSIRLFIKKKFYIEYTQKKSFVNLDPSFFCEQ